MSSKKFNDLLKQCNNNLDKAWYIVDQLPKYRQYWMWKNNIIFLYQQQKNDSTSLPFDKDVANWLLFALRSSSTYEQSFIYNCPFLVRDYHTNLTNGEKPKSIIQCEGNNIYQAVIPRIDPGLYTYYNGQLSLALYSSVKYIPNKHKETVDNYYKFFPVTLKYTNDKPYKSFSLVGNRLSTDDTTGGRYIFKIADLQRAELVKNLGYNLKWSFSINTNVLQMEYGRGFVYIPVIKL